MLYLFYAMPLEAKPLIRHYKLKKTRDTDPFSRYSGDGILLTVTGMGRVDAAAGVASTFALYPPQDTDLLLNIGTAAGRVVGQWLIGNKIRELSTGRDFYPDMVHSTGLPETPIFTSDVIVDDMPEEGVVEMEASAVYQAANRYLGPHQMVFLKMVSDRGADSGLPSMEALERLLDREDLYRVIDSLLRSVPASPEDPVREIYDRLLQELHASETMGHALHQHLLYAYLEGTDPEAVLAPFYADGRLPAVDRQRGKRLLPQIEKALLDAAVQ